MNDTPTNGRDLSPPEQYDEYVKRCIDQRALAICVEAIQPLLDRLITAEGEIIITRERADSVVKALATNGFKVRSAEAAIRSAEKNLASLAASVTVNECAVKTCDAAIGAMDKRIAAIERQNLNSTPKSPPAMFMGCDLIELHRRIEQCAEMVVIDENQKAALHDALEMAFKYARSSIFPQPGASA